MLVEAGSSKTVEDLVSILFRSALENLEILEDLWINLYFIVETDRIFAKEIENDSVRRPQSDVLHLE